jgi:hypothetical protein
MNTSDENENMISDCEKRSDQLTDWELKFIDSVRSYFDGGGFLSEKQETALERIWDRVTK